MFRNLLANMSPAVKNILILNVIFFFAQWALPQFMPSLMLFPFGSENFEPWQLATHFFMHGGIGHLFFNMFALVIFGSNLERVWGPKRFLIYYIACAFGAALIHMLVNYLRIQGIEAQLSSAEINQVYNEGFDLLNTGYNYQGIGGELNSLLNTPMLGASGAVFGLLAAFGYLFPNTELMLLFPPIPIKAKFFVIGYAALELYLGFSNNPTDNVAHFAHLGGALVGIIIVLIWQRNKNQFF
ncbi:MAG: rhomboid family intramembrane serine protease [Flavobacteriales bacterium]|nr:rhomboid family intramembrane serine protease [Flavobacteriales bacterium]